MRPWLTEKYWNKNHPSQGWEQLAAFEVWLTENMHDEDAKNAYLEIASSPAQIAIYAVCCNLANEIDALKAELDQLSKHHAIVEHEVIMLRKEKK